MIHHNVFLSGSRENIIKMLNTAIRSIGEANVIEEGDDITSINNKLGTCQSWKYTLVDFLPENSREGNPIQEKVLEDQRFRKQLEEEGKDPDTCCYYLVGIHEVEESVAGLTVSLGMYYHDCCESYWDEDWENWSKDIVRLYGDKIIMDLHWYCNGAFEGITTYVYELKNGIVEETCIQPEVDFSEYNKAFDRLMEINPVRYLQYKIDAYISLHESLEESIKIMEKQLEEEKLKPKCPEKPDEHIADSSETKESSSEYDPNDLPF